jgi:hypothetical protein
LDEPAVNFQPVHPVDLRDPVILSSLRSGLQNKLFFSTSHALAEGLLAP